MLAFFVSSVKNNPRSLCVAAKDSWLGIVNLLRSGEFIAPVPFAINSLRLLHPYCLSTHQSIRSELFLAINKFKVQ